MIDRQKLLSDLQSLLRKLEADLLERSTSNEVTEVGQTLQAEYQNAKKAERTAQSYEEWRSDYITQIAAAWVLSCVFARFLEDNRLVDPPRISGQSSVASDQLSGNRLQRARDEHELYFRTHPTHTDREYLLQVFDELTCLPGAREIFGQHNPIHELSMWLSGDAAGELLKFFQKIDANTGALVHDFTDPSWDTRFLGDLYQDVSEAARKKYALLQTPEFVEEFILDRTLDPAIEEFGLEGFRMIDPACGSGHFLLGSFRRLVERWQKKEPGTNVRVLVQRALDSVHGVDVNPYAVAIARFRLLLAALRECGIHRLQDAPDFHFNLAVGDSLLHGVRGREQQVMHFHELAHHYQSEDLPALQRILVLGTYHAVVANPPYITPKDKALNEAYRDRYSTCHRQYSLAVPFMERIFGLATNGGFTGQITANSFMKREFGKKLIEEFLPRVDLTHVIDTSGAYIPGHGTPTVILFGRNRLPVGSEVRAVLGIRGEPTTPDDPAQGKVWRSIVDHLDQNGSQNEFVSVTNIPKLTFAKHPWSIGGGGAAELKAQLDETADKRLEDICNEIGFGAVTREDEVYLVSKKVALRRKVSKSEIRPLVIGEEIRDWGIPDSPGAIWPYDHQTLRVTDSESTQHFLWLWKTQLSDRVAYGLNQLERGLKWYEYSMFFRERFRTPLSITFAFVATHNHFVLDRGGKVFKQSAPVIKLPKDATEDDHLALLALLNSSTACFWMKQVFHNKGATSDTGILQADPEKFRYEFDGTKLQKFPIPQLSAEQRECLIALSRALDSRGRELSGFLFDQYISKVLQQGAELQRSLQEVIKKRDRYRLEMVRLQEELDWLCYELFELITPNFLARSRVWTQPLEEMPLVEAEDRPYRHKDGSSLETWDRVDLERWREISTDLNLGLVESPEYKRRWFRSAGAYDDTNLDDSILLQRSIVRWLLDRLESYFDFDGRMNNEGKPTAKLDVALVSIARLADVARQDADFMLVGELYRDDPAFDAQKLVNELVEAESVPLLPILRYKDGGLRKRAEWERTWELQRLEDKLQAGEKIDLSAKDYELRSKNLELSSSNLKKSDLISRLDIPVPPKYTSADFQSSTYWRLRGKLDVPKERWVSFPHCAGEDGTLMIAWAGYDHLQLARAISAYYVDVQERLGGREDPRLGPLLACLIELLPWLKQWHNDVDPEFGLPMGDYFEGFIQEEARPMGKTLDDIKAWQPPSRTGRQSHAKTRRRKEEGGSS